ncbi:hypothetical protein [Aquabacterium sp.]|uniref:hypothetical protein n=1 Tax=Aquabacterium sp. TaxID=1872578 RepID=UPI002BD953F1|nr:hypothetical protein [Aquabacterium sp.]HSW05432.1 hypothetical protein [Aquabacterium sp.]
MPSPSAPARTPLRQRARIGLVASAIGLTLGAVAPLAGAAPSAPAGPPRDLRDTGLFVAGSVDDIRPGIASFSPQYPLWSDGASKRRWLWIPAGKAIDASRPDAWQFPPGTRLWKEFSHQGRRVETRYIERRADGRWTYAAYVWNAEGSQALLAPAAGLPGWPVKDAPDGRYDIPAQADCQACHEGAAVPVLGAGALQLSPDRDPLAAHAAPAAPSDVDLRGLVDRGWLRHLPPSLISQPPRIAAASPTERAALGYLHANCGHCHNDNGTPAPVRLRLAQSVATPQAGAQQVLRTLLELPARYRPAGAITDAPVIVPGQPEASALRQRMHSRQPQAQMPPLGTRVADAQGLALIDSWIRTHLSARQALASTPTNTLKETPP